MISVFSGVLVLFYTAKLAVRDERKLALSVGSLSRQRDKGKTNVQYKEPVQRKGFVL